MPVPGLGQPPAPGTLGLVVYVRDSFSAHLVCLPFNIAFILALPSQHANFLVAARPHVLLHYPEVSFSRPSAAPVSFGLQFPEVLWRSAYLSFPRPQFPEISVSRRLSPYSISSCAGLASTGQEAHSDDVTPRNRTRGSLSGLSPPHSVIPFAGRRGWPEQ